MYGVEGQLCFVNYDFGYDDSLPKDCRVDFQDGSIVAITEEKFILVAPNNDKEYLESTPKMKIWEGLLSTDSKDCYEGVIWRDVEMNRGDVDSRSIQYKDISQVALGPQRFYYSMSSPCRSVGEPFGG